MEAPDTEEMEGEMPETTDAQESDGEEDLEEKSIKANVEELEPTEPENAETEEEDNVGEENGQ